MNSEAPAGHRFRCLRIESPRANALPGQVKVNLSVNLSAGCAWHVADLRGHISSARPAGTGIKARNRRGRGPMARRGNENLSSKTLGDYSDLLPANNFRQAFRC
jgi:hypothetical protein